MPARRASLAITDTYRRQFAQINQETAVLIGQSFIDLVRVDDLDGNFRRYLPYATGVINQAKIQQVALADNYAAAYVGSETRSRRRPTGISAEDYLDKDRFDRPMAEALAPSVMTVKMGLGQGLTVPIAVAAGAARISRMGAADVAFTARDALSTVFSQSDDIVGWRRVCSDNSCGACLGAATGAIRADDDIPEAHDNCQCTAEPVVKDVQETVERPTGQDIFDSKSEEEQNALFDGRGGAEKADLIREGMPISDLIQREELALGGTSITEKPLSSLTA